MAGRSRGHYGEITDLARGDGEPMASDALAAVHETIQRLWDVGTVGDLTDAQLLQHFLTGPEERSETAFAVLVERHGPAVRRACLDLLHNPHDADDAAQAAFLILARKARSIRRPEALASWLHGVAVRLARRRAEERPGLDLADRVYLFTR